MSKGRADGAEASVVDYDGRDMGFLVQREVRWFMSVDIDSTRSTEVAHVVEINEDRSAGIHVAS
jgi:hypothetical protein